MPISDSDPITESDDFNSLIYDMLSSVQYKLFGLIFIVFLILSSDVFINRVLTNFAGAVDYKHPTSWGTILQGLFLVLSCIAIDACVRMDII